MAGERLTVGLLIGVICLVASVTATASGSSVGEENLQHLDVKASDTESQPSYGDSSAPVLPSGSSSADSHQLALAHPTVIPDPALASRLEGPMPAMKFHCQGASGYFVEPTFSCKAFHYCDNKGTRYSFLCDEGTTFNQLLGQCEPGEIPGCGSSRSPDALPEEPRPALVTESRQRGQSIRPHHPADIAEDSSTASPANPDGDILQGAESVKSEQLRHPSDRRGGGQVAAEQFQDGFGAPEPRVVTISPRVPAAESIRSTTGRPLQITQGDIGEAQFPDDTGNAAPFFNGAASPTPFRDNVANGAPFFENQFQQPGSAGRGFAGQDTGFGFDGQSSGFDGRSAGINGQVSPLNNQGVGFDGQNARFAPGFNDLDPAFGGAGVGFDVPNARFAGGSPGFVQPDPRFSGQDPVFTGPNQGFVAQQPVFNAPPPDFSSGVPFAFREFGGVPTGQEQSPVTPADTGAGAGSASDTVHEDTGAIGTQTSNGAKQKESAFGASDKVGRLTGNGGQFLGRQGNNPIRFAPVVAEGNTFQPGVRLDNRQVGFQQNGFQQVNGGFPVRGRAVDQAINNIQPVSQRQNPFVTPGNSPRFSPSNGRFIQGNLEILFPQQFREDPSGFRPSNPGVLQPRRDIFTTDQERFSPDQRRLPPAHQGVFPGQAGFPQEQNQFPTDQGNFQTINGRFSEIQDDFPRQQNAFGQRGFPLETSSPVGQDRFLSEEERQTSTFDGPLKTGDEFPPRSSIQGRKNVGLDQPPADRRSTQQADPSDFDKLTTNRRQRQPKGRARINRGKFPLPRDQFFEAKKESNSAEGKLVEQENQNKDIIKHALENGENREPVRDELHTGQTRLRPNHAGFPPGPGGDGLGRVAFPTDQEPFRTRPREQNFRTNQNIIPPEHRSFDPRFSQGFTQNQDQFSPSQRFPQDAGSFENDQNRFLPNGDRFQANRNRFAPQQNQFSSNQNQFSPNSNQFVADQNRFTPGLGGFSGGQNRFPQASVDQTGISNQDRFTTDQLNPSQNRIQQDQGRFFAQDNFRHSTPQFPEQPSFQPNQGRFGQNLNAPNPNGNRLQDQRGLSNNPNQFQQNNFGFAQDANSLGQGFDGFGNFGGSPAPQDPRFSLQNGFTRNPNQFQPQTGPGQSQFPSTPGRDAFAPPQNNNIHSNRILDEQDTFEVTTAAPPPRIIAPLPKEMIDHMDKGDAAANSHHSAPSAPSGASAPSAPGRGRPGRRRKPPRIRPAPKGHVDGITAPSGTAQNRFGLSTSRRTPVRPAAPTTSPGTADVPIRRVLPGGHTSAIIRARPSGGHRRRPGARRRFNRRRSTTTPAPEVTTEIAEYVTSPSGTTEVTAPSAGGRGRLAKRRRFRGGFRQRPRNRLRRPERQDTAAETTGQRLPEHESDTAADATLERPQFLDTETTSPSGDGLLREPSTLDATTVKPDPVRRRRPGALARRRRLRGRKRIARPSLTSPSSAPSGTSPSTESGDQTDGRRYRDGDGVNGRRNVNNVVKDSDQSDNTWLDGTTAPTVLQQQQRPQPGSRRPPHRRFRPGRQRVNDFQGFGEEQTGPSAGNRDFQNARRGGAARFNSFQDGRRHGFDHNGDAGFQNVANEDSRSRGFEQNRFSGPALVQDDFLDSAASGPSHSLTNPGRRQQFRPQAHDTRFHDIVQDRGVFLRPSDLPTAPSALSSTAKPVTAPSRTDRFRSRAHLRPSVPPSQPTENSVLQEDVVTGRSIGRGPVTIVSTGTSVQPPSSTFDDATTAATDQTGFSWSEPAIESETTTRRNQRPSLPEVADLPPDLVDRRHHHSRSSTSLSDMLNGRRHSDKQADKHHQTDRRHWIHHARTTEATRATPSPTSAPTAVTIPTTPTRATTSAVPRGNKVSAGDGDWRAKPWTTSFEKAAARGSVSTPDEEDVSLDSITEMVAATTTQQPALPTRSDEEPRLPLQALFDNL